jgi:hypothetical protein
MRDCTIKKTVMHIVYIAVLLGMVACYETKPNDDQVNTQPFNLAQLASEKTAWEGQAMNHYRFTGDSWTNAQPTIPIIVKVMPDVEPELSYISKGGRTDSWGDMQIESGIPFEPFNGKTIDELYISIEVFMKSYINDTQFKTGVRYNQTYHYPELVYVYIAHGGLVSFQITEFEDLR